MDMPHCSKDCGACSAAKSGCSGGGCGSCCAKTRRPLDATERRLLLALAQTPFLPLVQYQRRSSYFGPREPLEPDSVYLFDPAEDCAQTIRTAFAVQSLADRGFVAVDADLPLSGCDYLPYRQCALMRQLQQDNPAHTIVLRTGSMALTAAGQDAVDDVEMDEL